jgi:hypothetical protein
MLFGLFQIGYLNWPGILGLTEFSGVWAYNPYLGKKRETCNDDPKQQERADHHLHQGHSLTLPGHQSQTA